MNQKSQYRMMTEGVIWKQILFFSIPLVLSNYLQQFYGLLDSMFVGKFVGHLELAAVGSTGALVNLLVGFFLGLSAGAGIIISQYFGARNFPMFKLAMHSSLIISFGGGFLLTVLGWYLTPVLLRLMNMPDEVFGYAMVYLRIYFLGMIPMMVYNMGAGILRAIGDSKRPMMILFYCMLLHLVLNYVLILVLEWGVVGAAVSTGVSQLASAIWVLILFIRSDGVEKVDFRLVRMDWQMFWKILKISVPAGFQSSIYAIANIMIQSYINVYGPIAMAGTAAYYRIDGFLYAPMAAVGVAVTTFVGQNIGARQYDRIRSGIRSAMTMTVLNSWAWCLLVILMRRPLLGLFTDSPEVLEAGIQVMMLMTPFVWIHSVTEVLIGTVRGSGNSFIPMVITLISICFFRIGWILLATPVWPGLRTVIAGFPLSWSATLVIFIIYFYRNSGNYLKAPES